MATQAAASSAHNEGEVTTTHKTGQAAELLIDRSTLSRPPSYVNRSIKDHDGLNLLFLYAELLSQLAGPYASVLQELWTIREEIAKLTNNLVTLSLHMDTTDLTFDNIRMLLTVLK